MARKEVDVDERGEGRRLLPGYAATQKVIVHKIPVKRSEKKHGERRVNTSQIRTTEHYRVFICKIK